jgi:hypothetical protein
MLDSISKIKKETKEAEEAVLRNDNEMRMATKKEEVENMETFI